MGQLEDTSVERAPAVLFLLAGPVMGGVVAAVGGGLWTATSMVVLGSLLSALSVKVQERRQRQRWPAPQRELDETVVPALRQALTWATPANARSLADETLELLRSRSGDLPLAPQPTDPFELEFLERTGADNLQRVSAYIAARCCPTDRSGERVRGFFYRALLEGRRDPFVDG